MVGTFDKNFEEASAAWANAIEARVRTESDTKRENQSRVNARIADLQAQLSAFDSPEAKERRAQIDNGRLQKSTYEKLLESARSVASEVERSSQILDGFTEVDTDLPSEVNGARTRIEEVIRDLRKSISSATKEAIEKIEKIDRDERSKDWWKNVEKSLVDAEEYKRELASKGLDMGAYSRISKEVVEQKELLNGLRQRASKLGELYEAEHEAEESVRRLQKERRQKRCEILQTVKDNLQLKFEVCDESEWSTWIEELRNKIPLRTGGFVNEVKNLAQWLWESDDEEKEHRIQLWRDSLANNDFAELMANTRIRQAFWTRISGLESRTRIRIATMIPDDVITMYFRRTEHHRDEDNSWQIVSSGSPGQRSASMLSFVLAYGREPLILDQPEDDLDTKWVSELVVKELRRNRWKRQIIVVTHNANIPVNADADRVVVLANTGSSLTIRKSKDGVLEDGPVELTVVRKAIQEIMEGGVEAFVRRERRYNNELNTYRLAREGMDYSRNLEQQRGLYDSPH